MATFTRVFVLTEDLAEKKHDLGADTLEVALCAAANAPTTSSAQLSDLTEISYTNASSRVITTTSSSQTSGAYKLVLADLDITASGGNIATFRYVVIFNQTSTGDRILGFIDYGSDLTVTNGNTFTVNFDGTAGAVTLGA